uniref:Uncharacterized protein n=1 Tax=Nicotiana tabacum TaxID=4097 RepID=A0A1S3YD59_TOBAC|nr:PREDICTED: uncharacterized protein LOC107774797 [Nicotiana tabacum]
MSSLTLKPIFLLQSYGSSSVDSRRLCSLISFQKKKTFRKQRFTLRAQSFDSSPNNNENDSKNDSKPPNGSMQKSRREILLEYVQNVQPEFMELFVKRAPQQVVDAMRQTVTNMIGTLPPQFFAITVTTVAENLAQLMYSVLMTGYMFRNAQFRLELQQSLEQAALPEAQEEKVSTFWCVDFVAIFWNYINYYSLLPNNASVSIWIIYFNIILVVLELFMSSLRLKSLSITHGIKDI